MAQNILCNRRVFLVAVAIVLVHQFALAGESAQNLATFAQHRQMALDSFVREQHAGISQQRTGTAYHAALTERQFSDWQKQRKREFEIFRAETERLWGEYHQSTSKVWAEYDGEKRSLVEVDFETGVVQVRAVVPRQASRQQEDSALVAGIVRAALSRGVAGSVPVAGSGRDALQVSVLEDLVGGVSGAVVDTASAEIFARSALAGDTRNESAAGQAAFKEVQCTFRLVPEHLRIRMERVLPFVKESCVAYGLEPALVLATIQVESACNPMARSQAGAVGLMQLVPWSGGREAYRQVYGVDAIPDDRMLLDPQTNIRLGCAYLSVLSGTYFGAVKNPLSRRHCVISGYNTGPGNVAVALSGTPQISEAVRRANAMAGESAVYKHLVGNLPFTETVTYLQLVTQAIGNYENR